MKQRLQYLVSQLFARGVAQYLAVLSVFTLVILIGMNAYFVGLFDEQALTAEGIRGDVDRGFWDSLWWSVKHVLDPGAFAEDYGANWPVLAISLALSVAGLGLLGTFIALVSSTFQKSLESSKRGNSVVIERGHTLILGWNQSVTGILRYFADINYQPRIVILAPVGVQHMQDAIESGRDDYRGLNIVLRSGLTSDAAELQRVALGDAGCVISVAHTRSGSDHPDIGSIKTLMLLDLQRWSGVRPALVAEVTERQNSDIADIAGGRQIPIVSSGEVISRVLVQCVRYPGLSEVYAALFSPRDNNIIVAEYPELEGDTFGSIAHRFATSVPIGFTWTVQTSQGQRTACALNVEPDYDMAADEQLVLLSAETSPSFGPDQNPQVIPATIRNQPRSAVPQNVAIIGWNRNIDEVLQEMNAHAAQGVHVTILSNVTHDEVMAPLNRIGHTLENLEIEVKTGDPVDRQVLASLDPWAFEGLMLLADHSRGGGDADASTIMTTLMLTDLQREMGRALPHVVIELEDKGNRSLLEGRLDADIVVTTELVSRHLAQISQQQVLGAIYRELLSAGGMEIALHAATDYTDSDEAVTFRELTLAAQQRYQVALGIRTDRDGFVISPNKDESWSLGKNDQLVVLAQQIYD